MINLFKRNQKKASDLKNNPPKINDTKVINSKVMPVKYTIDFSCMGSKNHPFGKVIEWQEDISITRPRTPKQIKARHLSTIQNRSRKINQAHARQ